MDTKETDTRVSGDGVMLHNSEYYKYIFKKTEKIVCSVFFIVRDTFQSGHEDAIVHDLELTSKTLLDTALRSLNVREEELDALARTLRFNLISLESQLRVAHAARKLSTQFLEVFLQEIAVLQRTLRQYTERTLKYTDTYSEERAMRPVRQTRVPQTTERNVRVSTPQTIQGTSRRERVIAVLRDAGSATIKDIADVITDCSEKTIQRELTALIKDYKVHREGERRWSKYSLISN